MIKTSEVGGNQRKIMDGEEKLREKVKLLQIELKTKEELRLSSKQQLVKKKRLHEK